MTAGARDEYIAAALDRALRWCDDHPYAGPLLTDICVGCGGSDWGERTNGRRFCRVCIRKPKGKRG